MLGGGKEMAGMTNKRQKGSLRPSRSNKGTSLKGETKKNKKPPSSSRGHKGESSSPTTLDIVFSFRSRSFLFFCPLQCSLTFSLFLSTFLSTWAEVPYWLPLYKGVNPSCHFCELLCSVPQVQPVSPDYCQGFWELEFRELHLAALLARHSGPLVAAGVVA